MDKYEYKLRADEIKALIAKGEYVEAASIADTIDWRRVKSVMMLCTISDLYKINRRFEDARDMLLLAYDRHPGGRSIVYSLCELSIKMGEFVQAVEYYKEFVQVAPKDSGRYVLQYKLYEAQEVSLEERIAVLEELKAKDYTEKWAYELAYLYHRIGLATRCVEECDELILWFGEGKYVMKAMELKMLHESLTDVQQERYNRMKGIGTPVTAPVQETFVQETEEISAQTAEESDIQVKVVNVGQYDTINMQRELALNMKELWEGPAVESPAEEESTPEEELAQTKVYGEVFLEEESSEEQQEEETIDPVTKAILAPMLNSDTGIIDLPDDETADELVEEQETKVEEVFFGETGEMDTTAAQIMEEMKLEAKGEKPVTFMEEVVEETVFAPADEEAAPETESTEPLANQATGDMKEWYVGEKPTGFEKILGMEYDGQISMIMPESEQVEKQITGQIRLEDVLLEWEKMKKDSEQKRMEAVRQRVLEQTGAMFTEFEAATRDGLLEKLENGSIDMDEIEEATVEAEEEIIPVDESVEAETEELAEIEEESEEESIEEEILEEELPEEEILAEVEEEISEEEIVEEEETVETEEIVESEEAVETEEIVESEEAVETEETVEVEEEINGDAVADEPEVFAEPEETLEEQEPAVAVEPTAEEEPSEEAEEPVAEPEANTSPDKKTEKSKVRPMSEEEQQLFAAYTHSKSAKEQIVHAIDTMSLAAYTGNVIITGEEGMDTLSLAKNLIKEVQQTDSNFSGKIAKISGASLNRKGIDEPMEKLVNGALIVQKAGELKKKTVENLHKALQQENTGIIVILEDTKKAINKLLKDNDVLEKSFNIRIDLEALDNDTLVAYGKQYALEQEYSIDEMGVLALHTCIADRQTSDHFVTISEVKGIVDDAIHNANKKSLGHFFDVLLAKRYDSEDMIILREKDFI